MALAKFGLDKSGTSTIAVTAEAKSDKGKPAKKIVHKLILGSEVPGSKGDRYARLEGNPAVAVLDAETVAELKRPPLDYVNHTLFQLDPAKVSAIERRQGNEVLEVVKKEKGWQLVQPGDQPADEDTVRLLVGQLAGLRAKRSSPFPRRISTPFGFDTVVTVRVEQDKGKTVDHKLVIGKLVEAKDSQDRYARLEKSDAVVVLSGAVLRQLLAPPWRVPRSVAGENPNGRQAGVRRRGSRKATFAKVDGNWKMTQPVNAEVEQLALLDFLKSFAELRAYRLEAEKPADLKPYGLDRPQAQWRLFQGDKEVLTLLVGGPEKDSKRLYAKLGNSDLVVLLEEKLSKQVLGEYRSRKIWPALDAVQVEELAFGYEKGGFTLNKKGSGWSVAGKPGMLVKTAVVRDTLDALARLQAERWVTDKAEDYKLFGLEPPTLTLAL